MSDSVSIESLRGVLAQIGREGHVADDRPSLERLRIVAVDLLHAVSEVLGDNHEHIERQRRASASQQKPTAAPGGDKSNSLGKVTLRAPRERLAGWQIARVVAYIDSHIDAEICTPQLAALTRLSSFHFCRAFHESLGTPPHRYVMRKRVERAQSIMLNTNVPLGQVAGDCGMADQSHFTKVFRRFVGESPGAWRRARTSQVG